MTDPLSEIMKRVQLEACVYFEREFHAPFAMEMGGKAVAQFHAVTGGSCILEYQGESREVRTGEILLFPRGAAHVLTDKPGQRPVSGESFMNSLADPVPLFSTGQHPARIICGHFAYSGEVAHPLFEDLPDLVHLRSVRSRQQSSLFILLDQIIPELADAEPGFQLIVDRLAEALLVLIIREHYRDNAAESGFLRALAAARLAKAVSRIHSDYASSLDLPGLARSAGMSRSALSKAFKETVAVSPIEYLSTWRIMIGRDLLLRTRLPLPEVAERVGYGSEVSFSRAFKRRLGVSPAVYRRRGSIG